MNQSKHVKNLSKYEMRVTAKMRVINEKEDKITYKESPFKSIIQDIRNKLSKNGNKLIKKGLYYAEKNERINRITSKKHQRKIN